MQETQNTNTRFQSATFQNKKLWLWKVQVCLGKTNASQLSYYRFWFQSVMKEMCHDVDDGAVRERLLTLMKTSWFTIYRARPPSWATVAYINFLQNVHWRSWLSMLSINWTFLLTATRDRKVRVFAESRPSGYRLFIVYRRCRVRFLFMVTLSILNFFFWDCNNVILKEAMIAQF
jgi:hypothetical protein